MDSNGNFQYDAALDAQFYFGQSGDTPIVGDWSGIGRARIGIFRAGLWVLDTTGSQSSNNATYYSFGVSGDLPVVGDWNGDLRAKVGIFRSGGWSVDYNGNGQWDAGDISATLGQAGDTPVVGNWNLVPGFVLSSPPTQSVSAGSAVSFSETVTDVNGFSAPVTFSYSGWPAGLSATFGPNPVNGSGSAVISVTASAGVAEGTYVLPFTGSGGGLFRTASVTVITGPARCTWTPTLENKLITFDNGATYSRFASWANYASNPSRGWTNRTVNAILSVPVGVGFSLALGPITNDSAPSVVVLPDSNGFNLADKGFGNYQGYFEASFSNPSCYSVSFTSNVPHSRPTPTISNLSKNSGVTGTAVNDVTISGSGFTLPDVDTGAYHGVTGVNVSGSGITATLNSEAVSSINASFNIDSNTIPGNYNVTVTAFGYTTNSLTFTVGDPTPQIRSIAPSSSYSDTDLAVQLTGTGFGTNPTVEVRANSDPASPLVPGIVATVVTGTSTDSLINANFTIADNVVPGDYAATVVSNGKFGTGFIGIGTQSRRSNAQKWTVTLRPTTTYTVRVRSFIQPNWIFGPDYCYDAYANPNPLIFHGDDRGFNANPPPQNYRTEQAAVFSPSTYFISNGEISQSQDTGVTRDYASLVLIQNPPGAQGNLIINPSIPDFATGLCTATDMFGRAQLDANVIINPYSAVRINSHKVSLQFAGHAKDPIFPESVTPAVDWHYTVTVDTQDPAHSTYTLSGVHDCYPAHEVYINDQSIWSFSPTSNDLINLAGCLAANILFPQIIVGKQGPIN